MNVIVSDIIQPVVIVFSSFILYHILFYKEIGETKKSFIPGLLS